MEKSDGKEYIKLLKERKKTSRVYRSYQLTGLILAEILEDRQHKSLYIKLAKNYNSEKLVSLAKNIVSRKSVLNKGAYFMRVLQKEIKSKKISAK